MSPVALLPAAVSIDAENLTVTLDARTPLAALRDALGARRLTCGLIAGAGPALDRERTAGAVVAGESGRAAVRDCLLAVRATLPDGGEVRFGSNAVKDVAGYDLKRLYIGSGNTFGTLREVTLKVAPLPM